MSDATGPVFDVPPARNLTDLDPDAAQRVWAVLQPPTRDQETPAEAMRKSILADPATHQWLGLAIANATARDPVDALRDAQMLAVYCELRLMEVGAAWRAD